jgi:malate/lactate dehydrogenase
VPWSEASIGGYALERVLTRVQLSRLEQRLARLWPPGPYALGLAAARVAEAIASPSRRTFTVLTVLSGEFGVRGLVGAIPAQLSSRGVESVRVPTLNTRERVQLGNAFQARPAP